MLLKSWRIIAANSSVVFFSLVIASSVFGTRGPASRRYLTFFLDLVFFAATGGPAGSPASRSALSRSRLAENAFCAISCSVIALPASTWRNALRAARSASVIGMGGSNSPGVFVISSPSARGVPAASRRLAEKLFANEISRSPEACCSGPPPEEACERSLAASPPCLLALAVSSPSFLRLQPELDQDIQPSAAGRLY